MKKINKTREMLGIRQNEMAYLLDTSREQWAMFESGKRDLPLQPFLKLCELERTLFLEIKPAAPTQLQQKSINQLLESLLKENKFRQFRLEHEIADTQKKHLAHARLSAMVTFINDRDAKEGKKESDPINRIPKKISRSIECAKTLLKQELELEMLRYEQTLLEAKMKNIGGSNE